MSSLIFGVLGIFAIILFAFISSHYQQSQRTKRKKKYLENFDRATKAREEKTKIKEEEMQIAEKNLSDERHSIFMSGSRNPVI